MTSPGRRPHVKRAKTLRKGNDYEGCMTSGGSDARYWAAMCRHAKARIGKIVRLANAIRSAYRG